VKDKLSILIADDNMDFAKNLTNYIDKEEEMEVIGIAKDGLEAVEMIKNTKPDIAIVNNEDFKNNDFFVNSFNYLSENNETKIFDINYVSLDNAKKLLDEDKIVGYILFLDDDIKISVKTNGVNETIIKYVVDEIKTNYNLIDDYYFNKLEKEITSLKLPENENIHIFAITLSN